MTDTEQIAQAEQWLENTANNIYDGRYIGKDCAKTALEIVRAFGVLENMLGEIASLASAGLCQAGAVGKHEFLKDIKKKCEVLGYDVLGDNPDLLTAIQSAKGEEE